MMIPCNYELNISRNGGHFARIELGQLLKADAFGKFEEFKARFPANDGFKVTMRYVECIGHEC